MSVKKRNDCVDLFLQEYKALEQSLSVLNMTVLDYENSQSGELSEMLKVCRIMRNYIVHHTNGSSFLTITEDQIDFLVKVRCQAEASERTLKDVTSQFKPIVLNVHSYYDILVRFASTGRSWLPVVDDKKLFLGILTCKRFLGMAQSLLKDDGSAQRLFVLTKSLLIKDQKAESVVSVQSDARMSSVEFGQEFVSLTKNNTYFGISDWSKV